MPPAACLGVVRVGSKSRLCACVKACAQQVVCAAATNQGGGSEKKVLPLQYAAWQGVLYGRRWQVCWHSGRDTMCLGKEVVSEMPTEGMLCGSVGM